MAKRWKHWVRVVEDVAPEGAEREANAIIAREDFDAVVPRLATSAEGDVYTTILLYFRKQVEVAE